MLKFGNLWSAFVEFNFYESYETKYEQVRDLTNNSDILLISLR